MNIQATPPGGAGAIALDECEQDLVRTIRLLREIHPQAMEEVQQFVSSLVGRHFTWSYSDPASLERAVAFMTCDPFLRRESQSLSADFSPADADGLGD